MTGFSLKLRERVTEFSVLLIENCIDIFSFILGKVRSFINYPSSSNPNVSLVQEF